MKFKLQLGLFLIFILTSNVDAFEVNTHQAMTRCAITNECNKGGSANLDTFAENALLNKVDYSTNIYEKYNKTYRHYARTGTGFENYFISIPRNNYLGIVEAGVVLEDSVYHNENTWLQGADGRFNNHFHSVQFNSKDNCQNRSGMLSDKAACVGVGKRTDNISWALKEGVDLGNGRENDYNIHNAFNYYRASFEGTAEDRKKNQAKLFASLGFMIHMIQDLHSPAHVRDGSHPWGDYLEIYGRYDGGFNATGGIINPKNNGYITAGIRNIDMEYTMLTKGSYSSYQDIFTREANWVSNNFFSEAHNDMSKAKKKTTTGQGLDFDTTTDRDTIFDAYNSHPNTSETQENPIPNSETAYFGDKWNYIESNGNTTNEYGVIINNTLAIVEHGYLFNSERMMAVVDGKTEPTGGYSYNDYDKTPLSDTAINVIPRAVVSSQAFINYFFRGQMEATLGENDEDITITNTSNTNLVSSDDLVTFKQGMSIKLFYISDTDESKPLLDLQLANDVVAGETYTIPGVATALAGISDLGEEKKIIVLLDGQLGAIKSGALDDYNLNATGLVVAYASVRVTNADILFSFDKSGSMGVSIEDAKTSAKDILDDVIGIDNTSNSIEIQAFSYGAGVFHAYSSDVTAAKATIDSFYSRGNTALYDAIKLAGDNAVAHKIANGTKKSIVILYADGGENNSGASQQAAIDAISVQNASEIDHVFLIFVGSDTSGRKQLEAIANSAGRTFIAVTNAAALKDAIRRVLRGQ